MIDLLLIMLVYNIAVLFELCYTIYVTDLYTGDRKEVLAINTIHTIFVTVLSGVLCHCITKWLDRNNKDGNN